ncbi:MAG: cysteine--tRNA ligase [bacterium]
MGLKVFNSITRKKEYFRMKGDKTGIYVCGITPYDVTHLGHAFTYVFFDVLARYLEYLNCNPVYVQNLTDIDDDILRKSKELKKNWRKVVEENTQIFWGDMRWLNCLQPDVYPRATDHIKDIIKIVQCLVKKKMAYVRNGNVYFDIETDKRFGKLSKLSKRRMLVIANERGNFPDDPNKRNPLDFVLWQAKKPGEPSWFSPWGQGRPGWHIECSAMSVKYLGKTVDIHGGGADLIFPHHEASIAQSEYCNCQKFVRYWLHTGMVRYQGEKMSKSLGNLVLVKNLKKKYSQNVVRILLLSHHYRSGWEFKKSMLAGPVKINELFKKVWQFQSGTGKSLDISQHEKRFFEAIDDDFNTVLALKILENTAKLILRSKKDDVSNAKAFFNKAFNILGLVIEYNGRG